MALNFAVVLTAVNHLAEPLRQAGQNLGELETRLRGTKKEAEDFNKRWEETGQTMSRVGTGIAVAGAAMAAALVGAAVKAAQSGDKMYEMHLKTGMAVEDLSALKFAAENSGIGFDSLELGLRRMSKSAVDSADAIRKGKSALDVTDPEAQAAGKAYEKLGISVLTSGGKLKDQSALLKEVADKLRAMPDPMERSATAMQIFGRAGTEMLPLLMKGGDGITELMGKASALGLVMSDETAKQRHEFKIQMDVLSISAGRLATSLGAQLIPILQNIVGHLQNGATAVQKWIKEHSGMTRVIAIILLVGSVIAAFVGGAIVLVGKALFSWNMLTMALERNAVAAAAAGEANAAAGAAAAGGGAAAGAGGAMRGAGLGGILAGAGRLLAPVGALFASVWGFIAPALAAVGEAVGVVAAVIASLPIDTILIIIGVIVALGVAIWQLVTHWDAVTGFFKGLGSSIAEGLGTAWTAVVKFVGELPQKLGAGIQAAGLAVVYALGFMLGVLVNLPGYIAAQLRLALTAFQTWAVDTLAVAMVWVQALPQMIQVGLIAMGQAIRSWAIGAANAVWAWVTSALAAAQAWVVGLPQRVADGISAAVESAKQWMLALYNTVTGWFDGIVNWLKDLPARFWQAGSDAIGALVEGIKSKLHLVGGALDQGFRDAGKRLPHSDAEMGPFSRLTEAGRSIPQTIARGMAQGVGSVGRGLDALPGGRLQVSGTAGMAGAGGHPLVLELALPEGFYARQTHAAMQTPAGQQVIVRTVRKTASKGLG